MLVSTQDKWRRLRVRYKWRGRAIFPGGCAIPSCPAVNRRDTSRRPWEIAGRKITPASIAIGIRKAYGASLRSGRAFP